MNIYVEKVNGKNRKTLMNKKIENKKML